MNPMRTRWMIAGGNNCPTHLYRECPKVQQLLKRRALPIYKLAETAEVGNLLRCHWCRTTWLNEWLETGREVNPHD